MVELRAVPPGFPMYGALTLQRGTYSHDLLKNRGALVRPELRDARLHKPLTMLLFGMINWTFTWLRPDGDLSHAALAALVSDLFFGGLGAVHTPQPVPTP